MMLEIAERIALAAALGFVIGLERLRAGKEAGIRTFALVALAGSLSQLAGSPVYGALALILTGVVIAVATAHSLARRERPEVTTAAALAATSFIGLLAGQGQNFAAVSSTIIVLLLLAWKEEMVEFSRHLTGAEVHAAITLLLLGAVILPLLPARPVDPWGFVSSRHIWIMVVLISALGFGNYVLLRLYGTRSLLYAGFLGGLVNSTATVAQVAASTGDSGSLQPQDVLPAIMLAKTAMYLRNMAILILFAPAVLAAGGLPLGVMAAISVVMATPRLPRAGAHTPAMRLSSPFSLRAALGFGLYLLALTVAGGAAHRLFGAAGFYAVSFLGGMVSSSAVAATTAALARQGSLPVAVAGTGVVLASIGSAVALLPLLPRGERRGLLGRRVLAAVTLASAAALASLSVTRWAAQVLRAWLR